MLKPLTLSRYPRRSFDTCPSFRANPDRRCRRGAVAQLLRENPRCRVGGHRFGWLCTFRQSHAVRRHRPRSVPPNFTAAIRLLGKGRVIRQ